MVVVIFEMRQDLTDFYLNDCCINWERKNIGHSFGYCRSHDAFSLNITSIHWQTYSKFQNSDRLGPLRVLSQHDLEKIAVEK